MVRYLLLAAAVLAASPSLAASDQSDVTGRVRFSDLDLASANGKAALRKRIEDAASRVCGDSTIVTAQMDVAAFVCRQDAIRKAQSQVDTVLAAVSARHPGGAQLARN
jgi:UrcA family protein